MLTHYIAPSAERTRDFVRSRFAAQVWVEPLADGSMRVGVTALGVKLSGEFFMCRPKPVGQVLERGRSMAVAELAKGNI
jgi:glycine cleavage system H lipoate-binding protein